MITTTARRRTHQPTKTSRTRGSRGASRAITMLLAACLLLALTAVPATADPPERFEAPAPGFVFPDFGSGYWFFVNVNRDAVCGGPDPFVGTALFQKLETSDAVVRQSTTAAAKTWLHAFAGEPGSDFNPCDNTAPTAALRGVVNLRTNDNDVANEGNRRPRSGSGHRAPRRARRRRRRDRLAVSRLVDHARRDPTGRELRTPFHVRSRLDQG